MTPQALTRGRPGDARIEITDQTGDRVTVRVSGREVANTTSPDTVAGWAKTVAALRAQGWVVAS